MSGIYLKGIDMPEGLAERGFVIRGDGRVRTFVGTVYDDALAYRVPDHGRLVDAQYDPDDLDEPIKRTNYDRIISKKPKELAKFMGELPCCPPGADLKELCYPMDSCEGTDLQVQCWLDWLGQEAE